MFLNFSSLLKETIKSFVTEPVRTSYRSPWQNGVAERWIGSCRRELLNHVIIFNKNPLYKLLEEYVGYYNEDRTHYSLGKDPPFRRPVLKRNSEKMAFRSTGYLKFSQILHKYPAGYIIGERQVFFGKIEGFYDLITFEGTSVDEIKNAFQEAVEDYIDICRQF